MQNFSDAEAITFINSFVEAACWAETVMLDDGETCIAVDDCDLDPESLARLRGFAVSMLPKYAALIPSDVPRYAVCFNKIGHDAWLTMNNHGAGFWDRDAKSYFHSDDYTAQADAFLQAADELSQKHETPGYFYNAGKRDNGQIIAAFDA